MSLRLVLGANFQAWNFSVSNGCAFFHGNSPLYLSLCLSHKLRLDCSVA